MRKVIWAFLFLLMGMGLPAYADEIPDFPFIFSSGSANAEVSPDKVSVSFKVQDFNEDPEAAVKNIRKRSLELIKFFEEQKIQDEDVVAYEVTKNPVREKKGYRELKILGYQVSRSFTVTLNDLKKYPSFVGKLLSLENVFSIKSNFDRTDREEIERKLRLEASQKATEEGKNLAKGFGVKLGPVFAISQEGFRYLPAKFSAFPYSPRPKAIMSGEGDVFFVPSTITVRANVHAIFRIRE